VRLIIGAFALSTIWPLGASATNLIIVEARGVAIRVGETIDSTKPLTLSQGQQLTLIAPNGTTLKIEGPYDEAPDAYPIRGVSLRDMIRALGNRTQSDPGGARVMGPMGPTPQIVILPDPWVLDVTQKNPVCLKDGSSAVLWRPNSGVGATLTVMPTDRSWRLDSNWPAGLDRLTMPRQVPFHAEATYIVLLNGVEAALSVSRVPADLINDEVRVSWMAQKGCLSQVEALLRIP
jgi:hypothetical protein